MSKLIDQQELLDEIDGDLEFLAETVEILESDGRDLVEQLRNATRAGDKEGLVQHAHTLKGMVSNFSAEPVRLEAEAIEQAARRGELDGMQTRVDDFSAMFEELCVEARSMLGTDHA